MAVCTELYLALKADFIDPMELGFLKPFFKTSFLVFPVFPLQFIFFVLKNKMIPWHDGIYLYLHHLKDSNTCSLQVQGHPSSHNETLSQKEKSEKATAKVIYVCIYIIYVYIHICLLCLFALSHSILAHVH